MGGRLRCTIVLYYTVLSQSEGSVEPLCDVVMSFVSECETERKDGVKQGLECCVRWNVFF